jgi:hypothetical protein
LSGCLGAPDTERLSNLPAKVTALPSWEGLPVYDHIVIVVEENKDYSKLDGDKEKPFIIGNDDAKFINSTLRVEGASLTQMYAEEHFSQGNYFWLLSGSNQGVGFLDCVPAPGSINAENLASQLIAHGRSFKGFSEGLPSIGSTVDGHGDYARKHVPWIGFGNIPNGSTRDTSSNLRFEDFPRRDAEFDKLPTVAFVIPNLKNDMHDATIENGAGPVKRGDDWLAEKLGNYYRWAKTHNSLLIVTFDENAQGGLFRIGSTNPAATDPKDRNQIVTILAGAHIKSGEKYAEGTGVTHVNLLRTIEAMYGLNRSGRQQGWALKAGISDEKVITDVFKTVRKKKRGQK